jgi:hypothetical protein
MMWLLMFFRVVVVAFVAELRGKTYARVLAVRKFVTVYCVVTLLGAHSI